MNCCSEPQILKARLWRSPTFWWNTFEQNIYNPANSLELALNTVEYCCCLCCCTFCFCRVMYNSVRVFLYDHLFIKNAIKKYFQLVGLN